MTKKTSNKKNQNDRPEPGKIYALTGIGPCIANGNSWAESEVVEKYADSKLTSEGGSRSGLFRSVGAAALKVSEIDYQSTIDVSVVNYGGFRVHNWTLVVKKSISGVFKDERRFYLGQDAKVCRRILGADSDVLVRQYEDETGEKFSGRFDDLKGWLAERIIDAFVDGDADLQKKAARLFREAQDWEIAAE